MMKCKYCGGNLTLEQAYCPHCGRPNEEAAQHVKDMEHYKSNFEDTKSDVYEVAEKNTEIMSHMIIITVLVILCVVVFVVSARSWSIHRGLLQFDAGIRQSSYMKQMEQYLEDEDYIGYQLFATGITSGLIAVIIVMKNISCSWKPAERIVTFMKV